MRKREAAVATPLFERFPDAIRLASAGVATARARALQDLELQDLELQDLERPTRPAWRGRCRNARSAALGCLAAQGCRPCGRRSALAKRRQPAPHCCHYLEERWRL
jgi:hypothetical protein